MEVGWRSIFERAWKDTAAWFRKHALKAMFAIAAVIAIALLVSTTRATIESALPESWRRTLKESLPGVWLSIAVSVCGVALEAIFAYAYFLFRAPSVMFAELSQRLSDLAARVDALENRPKSTSERMAERKSAVWPRVRDELTTHADQHCAFFPGGPTARPGADWSTTRQKTVTFLRRHFLREIAESYRTADAHPLPDKPPEGLPPFSSWNDAQKRVYLFWRVLDQIQRLRGADSLNDAPEHFD